MKILIELTLEKILHKAVPSIISAKRLTHRLLYNRPGVTVDTGTVCLTDLETLFDVNFLLLIPLILKHQLSQFYLLIFQLYLQLILLLFCLHLLYCLKFQAKLLLMPLHDTFEVLSLNLKLILQFFHYLFIC